MAWVLGALSAGCGDRSIKTAEQASAVFKTISQLRPSNPEQALTEAQKAFDAAKARTFPAAWAPRFRLLYADVLIEQGRTSQAAGVLNFEAHDAETVTRRLASQAYLALKRHDYRLAREVNEEALPNLSVIDDPCWKAEVFVHYAQSLIHTDDSQAGGALKRAEQEAGKCPDPYQTAIFHFVKGNFAGTRFRYEEERASFETVLQLAKSNHFKALIPLARGNLARVYGNLGDLDRALALLAQAETSYSDANERGDLATDMIVRGAVHHLRDEDEAAVRDYQRAADLLKGRKDDSTFANLEELAAVLIDMNRLEQADFYNQEVVRDADPKSQPWIVKTAQVNAAGIARRRGQFDVALAQLREVQDGLKQEQDAEVLWRLHSELAQTLAALGRRNEAEREFAMAVDAGDEARSKIVDDWDRMTFSVYLTKLVALYIDFRIDHGDAGGALQLAETLRARRLAEKLHYDKMPAPHHFTQIARAKNAVILSYWIAAKRSYLWVTTAAGSKVFPLAGLATLERDIDNFNRAIHQQRDVLKDPGPASELFKKLVEPAEAAIPPGANVIIVPDGALANLNFETLIPPARPAKFWLESVCLTVAPSLAVLQNSRTPQRDERQLMLIGGTIPAREFKSLPGSELELQTIQQLFPQASEVLKGSGATAQRFLQVVESHPAGFWLQHISAHAVANKESPLDSAIILTPDADHTDGRLYAHDLTALKLNTHLVTLSACQGAGAKNVPGEGLVGLTWAVLSAGARNVVAGLWPVSDPATARFMRYFYTNLSTGQEPAQALHEAKLSVASQQPSPYYWAAFQLYTR